MACEDRNTFCTFVNGKGKKGDAGGDGVHVYSLAGFGKRSCGDEQHAQTKKTLFWKLATPFGSE